jgi:hypothetical protein
MTGKTFSGSYSLGFTLSSAGYDPVLVTGTFDVAAGVALYGASAIAWTITNQGTIASTDTAATGAGISLTAGGTVSNETGALISGYTGVFASGAAATVVNYGTIGVAPGFGNAVFLANGGFVSNASGGTLIGSGVGIEADGITTVFNQGAIDAPNALVGVSLHKGGLLNNAATGIITGTQFGAYFTSGAGTIVNAGTIGLTGSVGIGVGFAAGSTGLLVDEPGATFIGRVDGGNTIGATASSTLELASGGSVGTLAGLGTQFVDFAQVIIDGGASWALAASNTNIAGATLTNNASLEVAGTLQSYGLVVNSGEVNGLVMLSGGTLINAQGATMEGVTAPVYGSTGSSVGTVLNAGLLVGGGGTRSAGVALRSGGIVSNASTGTIGGGGVGIYINNVANTVDNSGTVLNYGSIGGVGTHANGVEIDGGGLVSNAAGGTISGTNHGVLIDVASASQSARLVNQGLITASSTGNAGVYVEDGGSVSNAGTITGGTIAVYGRVGGTTVVNAGLILNTNIGVKLHGGLLSNTSQGLIESGSKNAVYFAGAFGTANNAGTIQTTGTANFSAIYFRNGGIVSNASGGVISSAYHAIDAVNVASTLINAGDIRNSNQVNSAVAFDAGGLVANQAGGVIEASYYHGVYINQGTVTNAGTIENTSTQWTAVELNQGGVLVNAVTGLITSPHQDVLFTFGANATLSNAGTIAATGSNDVAVQFQGGLANRLIESPGAVIVGEVNGGNAIGNTLVSTLELASAASTGTISGIGSQFINFGSIEFDVGAHWFISGNTSGLGGTISGFALGDAIEVTGITATGSNYSGGVLTLMEASGSVDLNLPGSFATSDFIVTPSAGNTDITLACFVAGTRIGTERGPVAVERLHVGTRVVTHSGAMHPIVWIGRRRLDLRRHPAPQRACPVLIVAHAFGDGLPARDLCLSPDHAVFVDGVLIPVRYLVNGSTILRQDRMRAVSYYHVELVRHDILLAEDLPVESYLEAGGRAMFENGGAPLLLHPDFAVRAREAAGCARLVVTGAELRAVRQRLSLGAIRLGRRALPAGSA